jgi:hypothetical protein
MPAILWPYPITVRAGFLLKKWDFFENGPPHPSIWVGRKGGTATEAPLFLNWPFQREIMGIAEISLFIPAEVCYNITPASKYFFSNLKNVNLPE